AAFGGAERGLGRPRWRRSIRRRTLRSRVPTPLAAPSGWLAPPHPRAARRRRPIPRAEPQAVLPQRGHGAAAALPKMVGGGFIFLPPSVLPTTIGVGGVPVVGVDLKHVDHRVTSLR